MKPYEPQFEVGAQVRILPREELERFRTEWAYHNPLRTEQLDYGGAHAQVAEVGFYHGGEPLYRLSDIPGVWHEQCLSLS
jgi:hypothetical protein